MKNFKKLAKPDLKKINGGNAPICEPGARACRYKAENGQPAYWNCVAVEYPC